MPLPKPNKSEDKNKFISRCVSDSSMKSEFPDNDQRFAVCYSIFDRSRKSKTDEDFNAEIDKINSLEKKLDNVSHIEDLQEGPVNTGYKIVGYDGKKAFSLYDTKTAIDINKGDVIEDPNGIYLGTEEQFVLDFYTGLSDYDDLLLTYEYEDSDILKGSKHDKNSEIIVRKAKLVDIKKL